MQAHRENLSLMTSNSSGHFSEGSTATSDNESCGDVESWQSTNSSSCSSCSDSGSDEGSIEWESEVRSDGELYYIVSDPLHQSKNASDSVTEINNGSAEHTSGVKETTAKSWRNGGKLVRLIRRRESKRHRSNLQKNANLSGEREKQPSESPALNGIRKESSIRVIELHVDPWVKRNLGRRATISETLLGLVTVCHESDIFVTDYVPDSLASKQSLFKIGDKIASLNGKVVTPQNFNAVLEAVNMPMTLHIGISPNPHEEKQNLDTKSDKVFYQTPLAERISGRSSNYDNDYKKFLSQSSVGVLYLQLDGMTEGGPEDQGVLYCYPGDFKQNFLSSIRGAFLTLFHLIPDISQSPPKSSSILVKGQLVHVIYVQEGRELLLIAVPDCRCPIAEAMKQCNELVQMLQFTHQSLSRCFSSQEHTNFVNHTMCIFFSRLLLSDKWAEVTDQDAPSNMRTAPTHPQFELILPAAHLVPLPREAQMQIDDALSELESNDIGDSCEDLDCQRLYTILGSCLYHKGYLLASHFTHSDLLDVHAFCRQQGFLQLTQSESVRSLVIWKEVFPFSVSRGTTPSKHELLNTYTIPEGRWFIMIVGQKHDLLVTLLEAGGCSASLDGHHSPDVFYIEAAQDTLQHLRKTRVLNIASEWLETQLRPKLISPEMAIVSRNSSRRVNSLLGLRVHHDPIWQSSFSSILNSPSNRKSTDSLSTGKRRASPDHSSSGPLHGGETSEDSASLVASLPSDDTVFMKSRSERDHTHMSHSDHDASEDSDSDWEASDTHGGRRPTSTTDLSDLHNSLLKNVEGTVPSKLSTGPENVVFHYVHIDTNEGVLLSPVHSSYSTNLTEILSKFRSTAMQIHSLFQNTISFKKLKGVEASHSLINKSLVAIKEFGALFECNLPAKGNEKPSSMTFWVVGRLFFMPASREVYVCYEDSAPQNLIELAFRLALTTAG